MEQYFKEGVLIVDNSIKWTDNVAELWKKVVPPSRPSISELDIYSEYLRHLQKILKRKLDILVLGSTTEFRDWGFENNCNVFVVDYCEDYYNKISDGLKYKDCIKYEKTFFCKWQKMKFNDQFDIVIGDLATGNVPFSDLNILFNNIYSALRPNGLLLGKSMCYNPTKEIVSVNNIINEYTKSNIIDHPYTHIFYQLAIHYIDPKTYIWDNKKMYRQLCIMNSKNLLNENVFNALSVIKDMNVNFTVPPYKLFLEIAQHYFKIQDIRYGKDAYSKYFPLYIFQK